MSTEARSVSFEKLRKISQLTGLVLTKEVTRSEKIALIIYLFTTYLYCALFFSRKFGLHDEIEDLLYAAILANAIPRLTLMRVYRSKLADLLILLESTTSYRISRAETLRCELQGAFLRVCSLVMPMAFVCYVTSILSWLFTDRRSLPFGTMPMWMLNYNYTACFIFQTTLFIFMAADYILPDVIKLCIMLQLRIHFKYLGQNIKEVLDDAKAEFCSVNGIQSSLVNKHGVPWVHHQRQLKDIILHHDYVTRIASETENIFNKSVLASFVNLSFLICMILFRIANIPLFKGEFWKLCFYLIGACSFFFGDCYFTQRVISENEAFARCCYEVDFVGSNLAFQKSLLLLVAKAQRSVRFTIGKFAPVTVVTIVTIMKASFSYFTLLQKRHKQ